MIIERVSVGELEANCYIVACKSTRKAIVIDPGDEGPKIADYIDANGASIETYEYAKVIDVFNDLELGRLDAIICDSTVATSYLGEGSSYAITWQQGTEEGDDSEPEQFGVCIQKGNTALVDAINGALEQLEADGTLADILSRYF